MNIAASLRFSAFGDITGVWSEGAASGSVVPDLLGTRAAPGLTDAAERW